MAGSNLPYTELGLPEPQLWHRPSSPLFSFPATSHPSPSFAGGSAQDVCTAGEKRHPSPFEVPLVPALPRSPIPRDIAVLGLLEGSGTMYLHPRPCPGQIGAVTHLRWAHSAQDRETDRWTGTASQNLLVPQAVEAGGGLTLWQGQNGKIAI